MTQDLFVGVDIGGTFTDLILTDGTGTTTHNVKTLTTPDDPVQGVMKALCEAIALAGAQPTQVKRVVHATTLPTNLVLERKGARVALLTTRGFADIFEINKQYAKGPDAYDVNYRRPPSFVDRGLVFEADERVLASGAVHTPLDLAAAEETVRKVADLKPEAVAISLLHAYANPAHEQALADLVRRHLPGVYLAVSSEIWPECGEYERTVSTVISCYIGAKLAEYLERLAVDIRALGVDAPLQLMQSSGGVMAARDAARRAVYAIESGPAAGVMATAHISRFSGYSDLISFDMGGTTAKAGLVEAGRPRITQDFKVGGKASSRGSSGEPLRVPVIDLAEVGAGGGSIAWVDDGGFLRVGPHSAGAAPGPACYGLGGTEATVTDANVLLGYLNPDYFLGGKMQIFREKSEAAIGALAGKLGMDLMAVAQGIHDLANTHMGSAVRIVTLQRGVDPRDLAITASGGAGPIHVANLAEQFSIPVAIVAPSPGLLSALGLLVSDLNYDYIAATMTSAADPQIDLLEKAFAQMEARCREDLAGEPKVVIGRSIEFRFATQALVLATDIPDGPVSRDVVAGAVDRFRDRYFEMCGMRPVDAIRIVNCRVQATGLVEKPQVRSAAQGDGDVARAAKPSRPAFFPQAGGFVQTPVYDRPVLRPGDRIEGPAILEEPDSTTICPPGWTIDVDAYLNLLLRRRPTASPSDAAAGRQHELIR